jgi:hypothetical protein
MPIIPGQPSSNPIPPGPDTVGQLCLNALQEINVVAPGEQADPLDMDFTRRKFCQLVDSWNTQQVYIYASSLLSVDPNNNPYLLVPGLSPHTMGPAAIGNAPVPTFLVNNERSVRIVSANILLSNVNPIVRFPVEIRDKDWWSKQRVQTIQTSLPTDLYPRFDWPLMSLFFWPVPNKAYQAEFEIETILQGSLSLTQAFAAPPGYELAITLTLAELLCPSFEKQPSPVLIAAALKARQNVQGLNSSAPRINLDDFGAPSTSRPRASFNYHTGLDR